MARTRDAAATRAALLDAARRQFGRQGYDGTTTRSVAAEVGVDPALVVRYFGGKKQLFAEAAHLILDLPDLTGVPVDRVAELLLPRFFEVWEDGGTFLPLLRAAATDEETRQALLGVLATQVTPALASVAVDRPEDRAALVGSQLLGLAFVRYVLAAPPVVAMDRHELTAWLAPVLSRYLTGPAPAATRRGSGATMSP